MAFKNGIGPVHPGEVLREEFLAPLEMSVNALAKALGVPTPASIMWCGGGGAFRPILQCGWRAILAGMRGLR